MVRGKFKLIGSTEYSYSKEARTLTFSAVSNDGTEENARFHKYTPQGEIKITVDNPEALKQFEIGKEYYVDFKPA